MALALAGVSGVAAAQETHKVQLTVDGKRGEYRFSPATLTVRPGDVLEFKVADGAPHSVVFEARGLSPAAHEALNRAMPGRSADLSSPLLTENGAVYRITVPALPAGKYAFFCLPHRAYDMRGELRIE